MNFAPVDLGKEVIPVSVIIPCYNSSITLERAVLSVLNQTKRPSELILVDDGSEDNTLLLMEELRRVYGSECIIVLSLSDNQGPSVARNLGWDKANQPYIAFLDADDAWHPSKLEIQYNWMQEHPEVMITGHRCTVVDGIGEQIRIPEKWHSWEIKPSRLLLSNQFSTPSAMLRRDIPLRFDSAKVYAEDYLLWLQLTFGGYLVYFLDLPLAYLFKARFGKAGLSGHLWKMESGELDAYWHLYRNGNINVFLIIILCLYSLLKFLRRYILVIIH